MSAVEDLVGNAHGNLERVKELLDADPTLLNSRAPWNESPIEAATPMGNRPIIDFPIYRRAPLPLSRGAPVHIFPAAALGDLDHVRRELVDDPSRATARGVHDLPSLYFAAL